MLARRLGLLADGVTPGVVRSPLLVVASSKSSPSPTEEESFIPTVLLRDKEPDVVTAQLGAVEGGWEADGVDSTLFFRACLEDTGFFFLSALSARASNFLISLLSSKFGVCVPV